MMDYDSTYQNGEPGKTYNPGDEVIVTYFKNENESIEFKDYYWSTEIYCSFPSGIQVQLRRLNSYKARGFSLKRRLPSTC